MKKNPSNKTIAMLIAAAIACIAAILYAAAHDADGMLFVVLVSASCAVSACALFYAGWLLTDLEGDDE